MTAREVLTRNLRAGRLAMAVLGMSAVSASPAAAQAPGDDGLEANGLLRMGLRLESADLGGRDGFDLYDVRGKVSGRAGILLEYEVQAEFDAEAERVELLDVRLGFPIRDELLRLDLGQFKAPFGRERLMSTADLPFVERSQATNALAPGRQVGVQLSGRALEGRLDYRAGVFNGNGTTLDNDNDALMYAARVQYNTVGQVAFYEDLVVQVGASAAFSRDSLISVLPGVSGGGLPPPGGGLPPRPEPNLFPFSGDRLLLGADVLASWRTVSFAAEYLRGEFDLSVLDAEFESEGYYLQGGYELLGGAVQALLRYDAFTTAVDVAAAGRESQFLIPGVSVRPGYQTKLGLQYAIGLDDTTLGPGWADGQFLLNLQLEI